MGFIDHEHTKKKSKELRETDLYPPVKTFLEAQGYVVKAEVNSCDVVAVREEEAPIVVELKRSLSLDLLLQGVDRQTITDAVYLAIPSGKTARFRSQMKDATKLCKRLGLGLLSVRLSDGIVEVYCDPEPYQPRKVAKRKTALLREFHRRIGDFNKGGQVGQIVMTAYRQDVLRMIKLIKKEGPKKPKEFVALGISKAPSILQKDHYGWFYRVERGVYDLSEAGQKALVDFSNVIKQL